MKRANNRLRVTEELPPTLDGKLERLAEETIHLVGDLRYMVSLTCEVLMAQINKEDRRAHG